MGFLWTVAVAPSDIDELGHVNNVVFVRWVQEAAMAHSSSVGWPAEAFLRQGAAFVVRRHDIEYLRPALAGDVIDVETRVIAVGAATAERTTAIRRGDDLLARAQTRWVYVDLGSGRPTRIPEHMKARITVEPVPASSGVRRLPR